MDNFINVYGFLMVSMTLQALLALSLYLPLMTGQLSLASAGFYALGGYIAAIMSTTVFPPTAQGEVFPLPYLLLEMVLAAAASGVLAILIGIPALRLRGIYLALATIAFVEVVRVVSLNLPITGQAIGIFGVPQPFQGIGYLWVSLPLLIFSTWFIYRLERSRVGRAFAALREDELAAQAMGINPTFNKVLAFTLGAMLAGTVGAVSAHVINTWNARQGTFDVSVLVLAYVIIGGSRTYLGPVIGGLLLTALPEALRAVANTQGLPEFATQFLVEGRLIIYGVLIAVSTLFFPQGVITPEVLQRFSRKGRQR
ncbi:MAG: branched-chain amino acid ABC transporter permease [Anaerolineae bacterium]